MQILREDDFSEKTEMIIGLITFLNENLMNGVLSAISLDTMPMIADR